MRGNLPKWSVRIEGLKSICATLKIESGHWESTGVLLLSLSQLKESQEAILLMPPHSWIHGSLGTFIVEPDRGRPCVSRSVYGDRAMRFSKGSIEISLAQDVPLLRQVFHSQFVTHDQLFEFMDIGNVERKRPSFNWRVRRLVAHEFLERYYFPEIALSCVYRVGSRAAALAEFAPLFPMRARKPSVAPSMCTHWIELNEIHLSLLRRPGLLEEWISETEIVSRNLLTTCGYAKDYDALVALNVGNEPFRFALEYERSTKGKAAYMRIRERLESERQVHRFLYLASTTNLLSFLSSCFASTDAKLYLGLASDFIQSSLDAAVIEAWSLKPTVLRDAL